MNNQYQPKGNHLVFQPNLQHPFGDDFAKQVLNACYNQVGGVPGNNYPFLSNPEEQVWQNLVGTRSSHAVCELIHELNAPVHFSQLLARRFDNPQMVFDCLPVILTRLLEPQRPTSLFPAADNTPTYSELSDHVAVEIKELLGIERIESPAEQMMVLREALMGRLLREMTLYQEAGHSLLACSYQTIVSVIQELYPLFVKLGFAGPVTAGPLVLFSDNKYAEEFSVRSLSHYVGLSEETVAKHLSALADNNHDWVENEVIAVIRNLPSTLNHYPSAVEEATWRRTLADMEREIGREALLGLFHCAFMRTYN